MVSSASSFTSLTFGHIAAAIALIIIVTTPIAAAADPPSSVGDGTSTVDVGLRSSTAMVFLHGWLMGTDLWAGQMAELCGERRCYAVAQPGHGAPRFDDPVTMTHWAEVLHNELASAGIEHAVLVGHSMGGMLALEFARRYPDSVIGLGLVGTTDTPGQPDVVPAIAQQLATWNGEIAAGWAKFLIGAGFLADNPEWIGEFHDRVAGYDREWLPKLMGAIQGRDDLTGFTPTLEIPTVVIHSRTDGAVPFALGEALAGRIAGSELFTADDGGHAAPMETPDAVTLALRELLSRVKTPME